MSKRGRSHKGCVVITPLVSSSEARTIILLECPKNMHSNGKEGNRGQSSSLAPPYRVAPRRATFVTGRGTNRLYAINNRQ